MKKLLSVLFALLAAITLIACNGEGTIQDLNNPIIHTVSIYDEDENLLNNYFVENGQAFDESNLDSFVMIFGDDFSHWSLQIGGNSFDFNNPISGSTSLYVVMDDVKLNPKTFTVTFDSANGTSVGAIDVEEGKTINKPTTPTRSGYTFVGWHLDNQSFDFTTPITANTTLVAVWRVNDEKPSPEIPDLSGYYSSLDGLTGTEFNNALTNMIKTKGTQQGSTNAVKEIDKLSGNTYYLIYDGNGSYGNREHVVPASYLRWAKKPEDDLHNLRAAKVSTNSDRSNYGFTDSSNHTNWALLSGKFFPGDEHKGDVARIVLYIATRNGIPFGAKAGNYGPIGDLSMFLRWHEEDPVNDFERTRNDRIFAKQGSRNPFIDYPEFATILWGTANSNINSVNNYATMIDYLLDNAILISSEFNNEMYLESNRKYIH